MQTINEYHKQKAKRDTLETAVIGTLFAFIWVLSACLIITAQ